MSDSGFHSIDFDFRNIKPFFFFFDLTIVLSKFICIVLKVFSGAHKKSNIRIIMISMLWKLGIHKTCIFIGNPTISLLQGLLHEGYFEKNNL